MPRCKRPAAPDPAGPAAAAGLLQCRVRPRPPVAGPSRNESKASSEIKTFALPMGLERRSHEASTMTEAAEVPPGPPSGA